MIRNKIQLGLFLGILAGIIDVIPMILQNLPLDADISAFSFWIVSGFLIATSELSLKPVIKGILVSFTVLLPCLIMIGWKEPQSLIPIIIMTTILGSILGFAINYFQNRLNK